VPSSPAVQIGVNCLSFGSGKWDPVSSQMLCLCLKLKNTEIPHPECQGIQLPLLKNQDSLMPTDISERRIILICWILGSICGRQHSCLHFLHGHRSQAAAYCSAGWHWG